MTGLPRILFLACLIGVNGVASSQPSSGALATDGRTKIEPGLCLRGPGNCQVRVLDSGAPQPMAPPDWVALFDGPPLGNAFVMTPTSADVLTCYTLPASKTPPYPSKNIFVREFTTASGTSYMEIDFGVSINQYSAGAGGGFAMDCIVDQDLDGDGLYTSPGESTFCSGVTASLKPYLQLEYNPSTGGVGGYHSYVGFVRAAPGKKSRITVNIFGYLSSLATSNSTFGCSPTLRVKY